AHRVPRAPFAHGPYQHLQSSRPRCGVTNEPVEREPVRNCLRQSSQAPACDGPRCTRVECQRSFICEHLVEDAHVAGFRCVEECGVVEGPINFQRWQDATYSRFAGDGLAH
ncbi:unnamed protein product, partial [Pylaiella littoralis]